MGKRDREVNGHAIYLRPTAKRHSVAVLAANAHALARPRALERLAALEAQARLGDVETLGSKLQVRCHVRILPRVTAVANRNHDLHRALDA